MKPIIFTSIAKNINLEAAGIAPIVEQKESSDLSLELPITEGLVKGAQFALHSDEETLEKGMLADTFSYIDTYRFPIVKKGSEMKKQLENCMKYLDKSRTACAKSMAKLEKKCDAKPETAPSTYLTGGMDGKFPMVPKMYSYAVMDEKTRGRTDSPMNMYNEEVRRYLSLCKDYCVAETMKDGVVDDREYTLSIKQAAQL